MWWSMALRGLDIRIGHTGVGDCVSASRTLEIVRVYADAKLGRCECVKRDMDLHALFETGLYTDL